MGTFKIQILMREKEILKSRKAVHGPVRPHPYGDNGTGGGKIHQIVNEGEWEARDLLNRSRFVSPT